MSDSIPTSEIAESAVTAAPEHTHCPYCQASLKAYWQRLTPSLVRSLVKLKKKVIEKNQNLVHKNELDLTHTEYGPFQKLRYFGLIAKVKGEGEVEYGTWLLTKRGNDFLYGRIAVPAKVLTYRNHIIEHGAEAITVGEVLRSWPFTETIETVQYEYQEPDSIPVFDATGQGQLFT